MVSNRKGVIDSEILDMALQACKWVMEENRQAGIVMEAMNAGRPIPGGTMSETLMLRTVELAAEALDMAESRKVTGNDSEIMTEALAACRCVIAQQQEIDECLDAIETGKPIPSGSMETVNGRLRTHAIRALELERQP